MSDFFNETNSVICKKCGGENKAGAKFCQNCGENLEKPPVEAEEVASTPWHGSGNNPYYSSAESGYGNSSQSPYQTSAPEVPENSQKTGLSIISMIFGIVSLVCCYLTIPLSIASIVMGIISLRKKYGGKGMAIAGIITSGLAILFYGALLILIIVLNINMPMDMIDWYRYSY